MDVSTGEERPVEGIVVPAPRGPDRVTDPATLAEENRRLRTLVTEMGIAAAAASFEHARTQKELRDERTRREEAEAEVLRLTEETEVDFKTGLRSEKALRARLLGFNSAISQGRIAEQRANPVRFTLLHLDFDGFGTINGIVSEPVADRLLRIIGRKLKAAVREDLAARAGGDEMVVVMADRSVIRTEEKRELRERIDQAGREAFEEFKHELAAEGETDLVRELDKIVLTGFSVGIANYNPRRHGNAEQVLVEASVDMHRNKRGRRVAAGLDPADKSTIPKQRS